MIKGDYLSAILKSDKTTVFSLKDIALLWSVSRADTVKLLC